MAALEIQGNGDSGTLVTDEHIQRTIDSLEDDQQKDFIQKCLHEDPSRRATARDLLFHSILFDVHSLKLLAAHSVVKSARKFIYYSNILSESVLVRWFQTDRNMYIRSLFTANLSETIIDERMQRLYKSNTVLADIQRISGLIEFKLSDVPSAEKLEKLVEDVKWVLKRSAIHIKSIRNSNW